PSPRRATGNRSPPVDSPSACIWQTSHLVPPRKWVGSAKRCIRRARSARRSCSRGIESWRSRSEAQTRGTGNAGGRLVGGGSEKIRIFRSAKRRPVEVGQPALRPLRLIGGVTSVEIGRRPALDRPHRREGVVLVDRGGGLEVEKVENVG